MARAKEPPDINTTEAELESYWSGRDALMDEMERLRFIENPVEAPDTMQIEEVRNSIGYSMVERVVGMLVADEYRLSVPPADDTQRAARASEQMERWTQAALPEIAKVSEDDPLDRCVENMVALGHGCMRLVHAPQRWAGFPRQKEKQSDEDYNKATELWKRARPLPIAWTSVHPKTVYPRWDELGLAMILERDERPVISLRPKRYNRAKEHPDLWEFDRLKGGLATVKFSQLWTRETLTYAVNGHVVHHQRHRYGQPPYIYAMGQTTSSPDPAKKGLSLLYPLRYLLPYLDRLLSQKGTAVRLWAWPTPVVKRSLALMQADPSLLEPPEYDIRPGKALSIWGDEDISYLVWQGNGPDADEQLRLVMQMIERAGLADVLYGQGIGAGDSGYLVNQLIAAARMKLKPLVEHAENAMERAIRLLWDVVEYEIRQPLHVYARGEGEGNRGWISLGPDDLNGYRQVEFKLSPMMPTDEYAVASMAANLMTAGIWSRRRAMERTGVEQPEAEEDRILIERWKASPQVQQVLLPEALKRFGLKVAPPEPAPADVFDQLQGAPPGLQQAVLQHMAGGQAQGQPPAPQGQPPAPQGDPVQVAAQMLQQGMPPQQVVQQLVQMGLPPEQAIQVVQQAIQMLQGGGTGGGTGAVMAAPGVQAAPGPPPAPAGAGLPRMGPQVRPSGIATGRAPGVKRTGMER